MSRQFPVLLALPIAVFFNFQTAFAQDNLNPASQNDSLLLVQKKNSYKLTVTKLIIPGAFITYGFASLKVPSLKQLNTSTRNEILEDNFKHVMWDNYTQYAPAVLAYGFNAVGIKAKHNFKDMTIVYLTSQIITAAITEPLKRIIKEKRPDNSNNLSFPSGHSATAFSSAQFLFLEYKDSNLWLSLVGYPIALYTAYYRVINDKHWVGDVVAGAGVGILSTQLAWSLYPKLHSLFSRKNKKSTTIILPMYQNKSVGIQIAKTF